MPVPVKLYTSNKYVYWSQRLIVTFPVTSCGIYMPFSHCANETFTGFCHLVSCSVVDCFLMEPEYASGIFSA